MKKILVAKEAIGGSLAYQAKIKERVKLALEKQINDLEKDGKLKVVHVGDVSEDNDGSEFRMTAVAQVEEVKPAAGKTGGK